VEDLNKQQIILLALLVSFVASVATSIMTYSLLNEAPLSVTQTINRIVERTVETVTPAQVNPPAVQEVKETVVVQEEELLIEAIAKNQNSLVRIWDKNTTATTEEEKAFYGIGIVVGESRVIASKIDLPDKEYEAALPGGIIATLKPISPNSGDKFSLFRLEGSENTELKAAALADSNTLQLGQTVIAIKGKDKNTISIGRLTSLIEQTPTEENSRFSLASADFQPGEARGWPVVNLKGEVVGLNISGAADFIPINVVKRELENLK
jgi:S1-C subfamily serine protease